MAAFILVLSLNAIRIYNYLLLAYAFMSWVPSLYQTVIGRLVVNLVSPILKPLKRLPLQFAGFDWSVMVAFFLLQGLSQLISRLAGVLL